MVLSSIVYTRYMYTLPTVLGGRFAASVSFCMYEYTIRRTVVVLDRV